MTTTRYFHGQITPALIAQSLIETFNKGNLQAKKMGEQDHIVVQISSPPNSQSGGHTSINVELNKIEDGVAIRVGEQDWLGIAASLGTTALTTLRRPFSLLGRLDDLAQDINNLQLIDKIWYTISKEVKELNASFELSERLRRVVCPYCGIANPVGASHCITCGAPLGETQLLTCPNCGFVVTSQDEICPNCGAKLK